jgi:2'-5' RNA ligase
MAKRLFLAVDIDDATREQVGRISAELRERMGARARASWVHPDRLHLTLQFFGDADEVVEQRVRVALDTPIPQRPFELSFRGLGFFPQRGSPRVLWLGIHAGVAELRRVQEILAGRGLSGAAPRAQDAGRAEEDRHTTVHDQGFTPHLTLARFRERVPRARIDDLQRISASAGPSRIDRVTLYESRLSPKGPAYLGVAEASLQP